MAASNPANGRGQPSKSGDDDLTSLAWLQTVNILPDSVASDDDQVSSPDFNSESEKFSFKSIESVSKASSRDKYYKAYFAVTDWW